MGQLLGCVAAMIADYGLCHFLVETNSLKEALAFQPFDELRGGCSLALHSSWQVLEIAAALPCCLDPGLPG